MRREVIVKSIERLLRDISECGIDRMFDEVTERLRNRGPKDDNRPIISFSVFQNYSVAVAKYGEAEIELARILELDTLFSADTWQRLFFEPDTTQIYEQYRNIKFAKAHLPKIIRLFEQEHVREAKTEQNLSKEINGKTPLTFILPEDTNEHSTPKRLINTLEAVTNMYSVFSVIEQEPDGDLIVLACDSGSDKSFDFLGLAKLMEEIRKFVISIWDRRVFYRHMHASQCIALIAESLPVVERIEALKLSKVLEPEEAEILKRKALQSATMLLESGIYIEDMVQQGTHSPRQLMRPEPKLLAAPDSVGSRSSAAHRESSNDGARFTSSIANGQLSPEENAILEHLLAKAKQSDTKLDATSKKKPSRRKPTRGT